MLNILNMAYWCTRRNPLIMLNTVIEWVVEAMPEYLG